MTTMNVQRTLNTKYKCSKCKKYYVEDGQDICQFCKLEMEKEG